ncbi:bacterial Ig-like domain-containing protein [Lactococcus taiwanensis]|uniref:bacterial Ig-like domain-containing protein n=1 Tax=Lactococcus taiwanensis TaxID=1151742 RepID=UPI003516678B
MKKIIKYILLSFIIIRAIIPLVGLASTSGTTTVNYDSTLPEVNKYKVEFNAGVGGSLLGNTLLYVQEGFSINEQEVPKPVASKGYIFDKWINKTNVPETIVYDWRSETISEPTVYLASFKYNKTSLNVKDITLYQGESWSAKDNFISATNVDGRPVEFNQVKVLGTENINLNRPGVYSVTYEYGGLVKTAKVTVKAKPVKQYTVNFKAGEGGSLSGKTTLKVESGKKVTILPTVKVKAGYTFDGWYKGNKHVDPKRTVILSNTTFIAKFKEQKIAMYRLYNKNSGEHFYTANRYERDSLKKVGWRYEGIGWYAPAKGNGSPVYRLYNANSGDHHYTLNAYERDSLKKVGWRYEGIGWYSKGKVPLYRQYNPNAKAGSHNYTTSKAENDALVKVGWRAEGIGWYALSK